jgi:hypothetical protein
MWQSNLSFLKDNESTPECQLLITPDYHYTNGPLNVFQIGNSNGLKTSMFHQINKRLLRGSPHNFHTDCMIIVFSFKVQIL